MITLDQTFEMAIKSKDSPSINLIGIELTTYFTNGINTTLCQYIEPKDFEAFREIYRTNFKDNKSKDGRYEVTGHTFGYDENHIMVNLSKDKEVKLKALKECRERKRAEAPFTLGINLSVLLEEIADIDALERENMSDAIINEVCYSTTSNFIYECIRNIASEERKHG